jgi:amphi-Trp domain-containing protein
MDLLEISQKERIGREAAAARLREFADMLARHNDVEFDRADVHFKVRVPDELELKIEFEVEDGGAELEIELSW